MFPELHPLAAQHAAANDELAQLTLDPSTPAHSREHARMLSLFHEAFGRGTAQVENVELIFNPNQVPPYVMNTYGWDRK